MDQNTMDQNTMDQKDVTTNTISDPKTPSLEQIARKTLEKMESAEMRHKMAVKTYEVYKGMACLKYS
jgi:hypothetical protein